MTMIWSTALVLGFLIFIHELGHYLAARSVGVRVEKFSIGFPPRILSLVSIDGGYELSFYFYKYSNKKLNWGPIYNTKISILNKIGTATEYVFALIPIGGYVKMSGVIDESMDENITEEEFEFNNKSFLAKVWILSAGVIMNVFTAFIIFTVISFYQGIPIVDAAIISEVTNNSPANSAGLMSGDEIIEINGSEISSWSDLVSIIQKIPNESAEILFMRGSSEMSTSLITESHSIQTENGMKNIGRIGVSPEYAYSSINFGEALNYGVKGTINGFGMMVMTFKMLASGSAGVKDLGGPIMIAKLAGQSAEMGIYALLTFMAFISLNLAFINILPIPGLDGGHIFLLVVELVINRPLSLKSRMIIQQVGMSFLLILMITVMFNDVLRLFN